MAQELRSHESSEEHELHPGKSPAGPELTDTPKVEKTLEVLVLPHAPHLGLRALEERTSTSVTWLQASHRYS
jgi:hypothetical protein